MSSCGPRRVQKISLGTMFECPRGDGLLSRIHRRLRREVCKTTEHLNQRAVFYSRFASHSASAGVKQTRPEDECYRNRSLCDSTLRTRLEHVKRILQCLKSAIDEQFADRSSLQPTRMMDMHTLRQNLAGGIFPNFINPSSKSYLDVPLRLIWKVLCLGHSLRFHAAKRSTWVGAGCLGG